MFVAILAAVCAFGASAQFRVGVRAGMNINKLHLQDVGKNVESDNRCGFTAGAMAEFTIPVVGISFDVSLMYTRMNSKMYYNRRARNEELIEGFLPDTREFQI